MVDQEVDELSLRLRNEALETEKNEPELSTLLRRTVLAPNVRTFEDAVASTIGYRLLGAPCVSDTPNKNKNKNNTMAKTSFCPDTLRTILQTSMSSSDHLELGHTMSHCVREDALAVCDRDPAAETLLEVVLFYKGYAALVCHRAARQKWLETLQSSSKRRRSFTALFLQSQASAVFGVDIHPASTLGCGILLDHGTGIVVGETAVVGDGCTILHGVTLGGTGKDQGDRHPKIGSHVLIGAGSSILGNVKVGDSAKIGAGSVVLRPIPSGATAVGAPARIVGRVLERNPGGDVDEVLEKVNFLHKSESISTFNSNLSVTSTDVSSDDEVVGNNLAYKMCPFRDYSLMGNHHSPKGSLTYKKLLSLLQPLGCTQCQVGEIFFALDVKNVGFVHKKHFQKNAMDVIKRLTNLESPRIQELITKATS